MLQTDVMLRQVVSTMGAVALLGALGCGKETRHDVYMRGLQVEGEAERGPCRIRFDGAAQAQVLDGDRVQECLEETERAIALYEQAMAMGSDQEPEVRQTHARSLERKKRLEDMLHQVRRMEQEAIEARGRQ